MNKLRLIVISGLLMISQGVFAAGVNQEDLDCVLTKFDTSDQIILSQLRGKVVYVDFWASWCSPCAKSFPFLNELQHEFGDRGLQIVGVNLDEKRGDAQEFLGKIPAHFQIAADPGQKCAKSFGLKGMPSCFWWIKTGRFIMLI